MRIAVFHNLPLGGAKRVLYEYVKRLKKDGNSVDLYVFSKDNDYFSLQGIVDNVYDFNLRKLSNNLFFLKYFNFFWAIIDLLFLLWVSSKIAKKIDSREYDFVFLTNCQITQNPCVLRYLRTKSFLYSQEPYRLAYESIIKKISYGNSLKSKLNYILLIPYRYLVAILDRQNILKADRVFVNSYFSRESFIRAYGINPIVVYLGADQNFFKNFELQKSSYVLSVGAFVKLKGHDFIIKALSLLDQKIRPKLLIVTNSKKDVQMENYFTALASKKDVILEIRYCIDEKQLVEYYNKALLTAYASIMEPFGLVVIESMACGTPVVGVLEGGMRELISNNINGLLIDRDVNKFAEALKSLLTNQARRENFSLAARESVLRKFTWAISYNCLLQNLR